MERCSHVLASRTAASGAIPFTHERARWEMGTWERAAMEEDEGLQEQGAIKEDLAKQPVADFAFAARGNAAEMAAPVMEGSTSSAQWRERVTFGVPPASSTARRWTLARFAVSVIAGPFTLILLYFWWLGYGCTPLLPLISELGTFRAMYVVFGCGMTLQAIAGLISQTEANRASVLLAIALGANREVVVLLCILNGAQLVLSVVISFGTAGVAWFSFTTRLGMHLLCAGFYFFGGLLWGLCNTPRLWLSYCVERHCSRKATCLDDRQRAVSMVAQTSKRPMLFAVCAQICLTVGASVFLLKCLEVWWLSDQAIFHQLSHETTKNFLEYCERDRQTLREMAVWEWLAVISLGCSFHTNLATLWAYWYAQSALEGVASTTGAGGETTPAHMQGDSPFPPAQHAQLRAP